MHLRTPLILALTSLTLSTAQSSTSSSAATPSISTTPSGCGHAIDLIIQACLQSTSGPLNACAPNDWKCMCTQVTNVLTCFNNCPSDLDAYGWQQKKLSWCGAAKMVPGSSSKVSSSGGKTTASISVATGSTTIHTGFASQSASASASGVVSGNDAPDLGPASGIFAAVIGLALL